MKTERSMQEVESLLLDSKPQKSDGEEQLAKTLPQQVDTEQQQVSPRLLRQKGLSVEIDDLEPVPYYKKGWIQIACVLMITIPLGWMLISAFRGCLRSIEFNSSVLRDNRSYEAETI
ncbi:hypothetical protein B7486_48175, partial [cyanobacterium TDX16]